MPWTAYWTTAPRQGALLTEPGREPGPDEALVRTLRSGISRGTEMLVHAGAVPEQVAATMRAPFQSGDWPGPVKYGYLSVGVVETGPDGWRGRRVFCLHPHQDRYVVPVSALTPVPDGVPSERAVLAGGMETAINAVWDGAPHLGDRIAVVGGGMIGGMIAALLRGFPLERLQLVDVDAGKDALASALGVQRVHPDEAADGCDLVFHASASEAGLARGLELLGEEGELIEVSWYGTREPRIPLGSAFHARRLTIRASQVGAVAASRRTRRTTADRLALALRELEDPRYEAFLTGRSPFCDLPETMESLFTSPSGELCHLVTYPEDGV